MTSGRLEIRRSVLLASNASTENTDERRTEMGKIVISGPQNVSLDGVVQDPDGEEGFRLGGWFVQFGGKDLEEWNKVALDEALRAEAWLLGRRSYEFFGVRWRPRSGALANRLNSLPKYVVSSTLDDPEWNNTTVLKGDVVTEVSKLKQELDGEIVVPASYQLGRTLIAHDLVDELRLVVFPVVLGAGERLFGETSDKKPMRLVDEPAAHGAAHLLVVRRRGRCRTNGLNEARPHIDPETASEVDRPKQEVPRIRREHRRKLIREFWKEVDLNPELHG
jgi:dihydrofolate reductase